MTPPDSPDARRPNVTHAMFRDPAPMDPADLSRVGGRLADPRTATVMGGIETSPTAYVGASLVLSARADADREALLTDLQAVADDEGWLVEVDDSETWSRARGRENEPEMGVTRLRLSVPEGSVAPAPDAWVLLQKFQAAHRDVEGMLGLDHVVRIHDDDESDQVDDVVHVSSCQVRTQQERNGAITIA